ncbi:MAG: restriction endonuclease subunit S [gamma proteobacterium symbiont of Taylorina sp.]|nr:restriction endonuclease subunit S [gamma proteobacterium symbiont of Taylorina sp.]
MIREKNYIVNEGDVCITVVGANIGDIGIVPKELHLANLTENANKLPIQDQTRLNGVYLCFAVQMDFIQRQINQKTMAVGVPKLALFRIQQLELLVPPIKLQNKFEEIVSQLKLISSKSLSLNNYSSTLFSSLTQKAFAGEL